MAAVSIAALLTNPGEDCAKRIFTEVNSRHTNFVRGSSDVRNEVIKTGKSEYVKRLLAKRTEIAPEMGSAGSISVKWPTVGLHCRGDR